MQYKPKSLTIQLDPDSGEVMGAALTHDIVLDNGDVITNHQSGWHEMDKAHLEACQAVADLCISAVKAAKRVS